MPSLGTRRLLVNKVNKRSRHNVTPLNTKFCCIIMVFIAIVIILAVSVLYFAATFPLIESQDQSVDLVKTALKTTHHSTKVMWNNAFGQSITNDIIYNDTRMILIRNMHESPIHLDSAPFLVGLGAEKSGSTSLGAAMFHSGEFSCPNREAIDVETKYWSDCFNWNQWGVDHAEAFIDKINNKHGGHCSITQYQSYAQWRTGKFKFEKSVDYLGLPYVTRIFSDIFVKKYGTKIFVMIRYPPPRISSTWKFFVGAEKDKMPNEYGNVEAFTRHLLKNNVLKELIELLDVNNGKTTKTLLELDWVNVILPKWNEYMISLLTQCQEEAVIAGFKPVFCNPSQLLRRAVGLSCYIVPLMQWIVDLGMDNAINSFRIIQSELYFENGKDIMDRLICWSKHGTVDLDKCRTESFYQSGSVQIKKLQGTIRSTNDFSHELIDILHSVFEPCNARLFELLQLYPQLALKQFVWDHWHFEPSM
eukprot:89306_1